MDYGIEDRAELLEIFEKLEKQGLRPMFEGPDGKIVSFWKAKEEVRNAWLDQWEFSKDCPERTKLLRTRLEDLKLSQRALSALSNANVRTVGDLIRFDKELLPKLRNVGRVTVAELDRLVKRLKLKWGTDATALILEDYEEWKKAKAAKQNAQRNI